MLKFYLLLSSMFVGVSRINADLIFTSPLRTKALLSTVDLVIETIQEYIKTEKDRVEFLEKYLNDWEEEHNRNAENPELHLGNHISLFNFLKKLNSWWPYWHEEAKKNSAENLIHKMRNKENSTWPTMEDMDGVMDSIINIQIIHDIEATALANGKFKKTSTNTRLDFSECLMMAKRCFDTVHYKLSLQWALVALQRYFIDRIKDEEQLSQVLYYISYTAYIKGEYDLAVESITAYTDRHPDDEKAKQLENIIHLKLPPDHEKSMAKKMDIFLSIKNLCNKITSEVELSRISYLRCRYNHKNSNYLKIAPLKEESLSVIPHISLFRDVLYDSEIQFLKEKSKDRLKEVVMDKDSDIKYDLVESATFEDNEFAEIAKISHRVNDMIGTRACPQDVFQLHKYHVGGSYADYEEKKIHEDLGKYSTVLFHMNDAIKGGSTIFPQHNLAVRPEKGTALVWFDDIQQRSNDIIRHSICSAVIGRNWTFTKRVFEKRKSPERKCGY